MTGPGEVRVEIADEFPIGGADGADGIAIRFPVAVKAGVELGVIA